MSSCRPWNVGTLQEKDKAEKCIPICETILKSYVFSSMKRRKKRSLGLSRNNFFLSNSPQWNQRCDISCKAACKSILGHRSPHHKQRLPLRAAATGSTPVCFRFVPHYRLCEIKPAKCWSKSKRKKTWLNKSAYLLRTSPVFVFVSPHFPHFITVISAISSQPPATALAAVLTFPRQKRNLISPALDGWMMFLWGKHMEFQSPELRRCRRTGGLNVLQQMD